MKEKLFRFTTGIAAVYHLVLGLAMLLLSEESLHGIGRILLGIDVVINPQLAMAGKFSAAYVLAFGVMLAMLCAKPVRLQALVIPVLALFGIRLANKVVWMAGIEEAFGVSRGRSWYAVATLAVIFGIIAWCRPVAGDTREKS